VKGDLDKLVAEARHGAIDVVYIALPLRAEPRINAIIRRLQDTTASVYLAYDFGGFDVLRAQWGQVGNVPVMSVVENPFHGIDGVAKRLEDLVLGSLIMLMIALPMLLVALAVKLTSRGPVFFKQRRYGLNGEEIRVLKFRTMTVMEDGPEVKQAQKNDQRVTKVGAVLRRTSLDELPQFIQVLTGEMSIVGPRPHAVVHNEQYRALIQGYMLRHKVKPGITGWAQVNGWRGETDTLEKMEKRVEYDLAYIRDWALLMDLKIILMTILGAFRGKNAY
jgi:putative colanic acid biosynthesis UDP-glucose lipid carrier transferase